MGQTQPSDKTDTGGLPGQEQDTPAGTQARGDGFCSTLSVEEASKILKDTMRFINENFVENIDFERRVKTKKNEGTGKKESWEERTLLKPGAEKLILKFKLRPELILQERILDWERRLYYFEYLCKLVHIPTGLEIAQYVASCNSWEEKYRYRWLYKNKLPIGTDETNLVSRGGEGYTQYRIENPLIEDSISTIAQIAAKRVFVGCVRLATATSSYFAKDEGIPNESGDEYSGQSGANARANRGKGPAMQKEPSSNTPASQLTDELYTFFEGDEDAVQEFVRNTLSVKGIVPIQKLPPQKMDAIKAALEKEKELKNETAGEGDV